MFLITYERIAVSGFDDLEMNYIVESLIPNDTLLSSLGLSFPDIRKYIPKI